MDFFRIISSNKVNGIYIFNNNESKTKYGDKEIYNIFIKLTIDKYVIIFRKK